jgi:hypothetical protein
MNLEDRTYYDLISVADTVVVSSTIAMGTNCDRFCDGSNREREREREREDNQRVTKFHDKNKWYTAIYLSVCNRYIGKGVQGRDDGFLWTEHAEYHAAKPESRNEYMFVSGIFVSLSFSQVINLKLNAYGQ